MLKQYFEKDMEIAMSGLQYIREQFNKVLPNHICTTYGLRFTRVAKSVEWQNLQGTNLSVIAGED